MAANKVIPKKSKKIKQLHWITDKIKQLMEKRRKYKTDPNQYKEMHKEIQEKCKTAKNKWMEDKCHEIEHKNNNIKDIFNII